MYPCGGEGVGASVWNHWNLSGPGVNVHPPVLDHQYRCDVLHDDAAGDLHLVSAPEGEPLRGLFWFRRGHGPACSGRRTTA